MESKQTLYNKYRPLSFADVVNQNHIKVTLQNEIADNKLAHAYIFNGPRGIGKTTIARILAKAVNCTNRKEGEYEPCNKCESCLEVDNGKSLSMVEIDAASQTKVDQTRENIIAASRISASSGKTKIFIIDEVHMLSTASFNALLKTLEEPPAKVLFILATTEIHKVPETIISRCQRFDYHRLSVVDLVDWMDNICRSEKHEVDKDVLQAIAKQAEGGARDALSILGQVLTLSDKKITFNEASLVLPRSDIKIISQISEYVINNQAAEAIDLLNQSLMEGVNLNQFCIDWIDYFRQLLILNLSADKSIIQNAFDKEIRANMLKQVERLSANRLVYIIDTLLNKYQQIKLSSIPHLPIELAIVVICQTDNEKKINNNEDSSGKTGIPQKKKEKPTQQPKVEIEKTIEAPPAVNSNLKLEDIQPKWLEILIALKEYNHSMSALMKVARPISYKNGIFTVGFQYSFHMEVLEDKNKKRAIEEIMTKHLKEPIVIQSIIDDQYDQRTVWEVEIKGNEQVEDDSPEDLVPMSTEIDNMIEKDAEVDVVVAFS